MKKMRMCFPREKTFADGFGEYILDCKARNLRDGTIHHYEESIKQIYKHAPANTALVQRLLQHSTASVIQRHISIGPLRIEAAIEDHAQLL